jgi:glycosyltransferase 2 family protein
MDVHRRVQRLLDAVDRIQNNARLAGAQDDGRDHDVQAVETAGRKKARNRIGAAFDENAAKPEAGKTGKDGCRGNVPVGCRQSENFDVGERTGRSLRRHHESARAIGVEQARARTQSSTWIKNDARWMRPDDATDGELGIVGERSPYSDDDGIDDGAEPMQMGEARWPIDIVRVSGHRRDTAVERLSNLSDNDEIIDASLAQRTEQVLPRRRERIGRSAKQRGYGVPGPKDIDGTGHKFYPASNRAISRKKMEDPRSRSDYNY